MLVLVMCVSSAVTTDILSELMVPTSLSSPQKQIKRDAQTPMKKKAAFRI